MLPSFGQEMSRSASPPSEFEFAIDEAKRTLKLDPLQTAPHPSFTSMKSFNVLQVPV